MCDAMRAGPDIARIITLAEAGLDYRQGLVVVDRLIGRLAEGGSVVPVRELQAVREYIARVLHGRER